MKKICLVVICVLLVYISEAEQFAPKGDNTIEKGKLSTLFEKSFIIASYQDLRSTHYDHFTGFNMMAGYHVTSKFSLGLGVEDVFGLHHDDNGLKLSEIRMVPVFINGRYLFGENRLIVPFIELSAGITFLKYYEKVQVPSGSTDITETDGIYNFGPPFLVQERGLYTYFGSGAYIRISKHFMPFIGIGFKGYHLSSNNLTINPHGINLGIGCKF